MAVVVWLKIRDYDIKHKLCRLFVGVVVWLKIRDYDIFY